MKEVTSKLTDLHGKNNTNSYWASGEYIVCFSGKLPQFSKKQRNFHVFLINGLFCCNSILLNIRCVQVHMYITVAENPTVMA
jgi:hypothetical protein